MEPLPPALHDQGSSEEMDMAILARRSARPRAVGHGPDASGGHISYGGARHLAATLSAHPIPRVNCPCSKDLKTYLYVGKGNEGFDMY